MASFLCSRLSDKGFIGGINLDKKYTDRDQSTSTNSILADKKNKKYYPIILPSLSSSKTRKNSLIFS